MSKIALDKNKINPEHINFLKQNFKEKTSSGAIYRLIEFYSIKYKNERENFSQTSNELLELKHEFNKLKTYLKAKKTAENYINQIINEQ